MTSIAEGWFWGSAALAVYAVVGYPLLVAVAGRMVNSQVRRSAILPAVDVVIPVHDGEAELDDKIRNCLAFDYPESLRTVWVVSDGSTDGTAAVVRRWADPAVRCLEIPERIGKVAAQNRVLPMLSGDIVAFTDLSIRMRPDALKLLVSNFADPEVGVVSCRDQVLESSDTGAGEGVYIRYDMMVRSHANRVGSLIGVTGGFYAVRRELARQDWNPAYPPDFHAALWAVENGLRAVEDERVLAYYSTAPTPSRELQRKVRTMTRGMQALLGHRRLLDPLRHPWVALSLLHHKLLRWVMPFVLASLYAATAVLAARQWWPFLPLWVLQTLFYLLGIAGLAGRVPPRWALARVPAFVVMFNLALLLAWTNLLTGRAFTTWEPTVRGADQQDLR